MISEKSGRNLSFWRQVFFAAIVLTTMAALYPNFRLSRLLFGLKIDDAVIHMGAFAIISLVAAHAFRLTLVTMVSLALFALALELAQAYSPGRQVNFGDAAASLSGIGLVFLVYFVSTHFGRTLQRLKSFLTNRHRQPNGRGNGRLGTSVQRSWLRRIGRMAFGDLTHRSFDE